MTKLVDHIEFFNYYSQTSISKIAKKQIESMPLIINYQASGIKSALCDCTNITPIIGCLITDVWRTTDFCICCEKVVQKIMNLHPSYIDINYYMPESSQVLNVLLSYYWPLIIIKTNDTDIENLLSISLSCETLSIFTSVFYTKNIDLCLKLLYTELVDEIYIKASYENIYKYFNLPRSSWSSYILKLNVIFISPHKLNDTYKYDIKEYLNVDD